MLQIFEPSDLRFAIRTVMVTIGVITVLLVISGNVVISNPRQGGAYCLYQNNYYSEGAVEQTAGVHRVCGYRANDPDGGLQWVDPR